MQKTVRTLSVTVLLATMITNASSAEFNAGALAAEEGKFAAYSVKNGMRAAFLEFFAHQSWLLRPEPVDAKAWLRARPDPAIVLDWKSQRTILSASGDLGFSTGPWILRSKADANAPTGHGQFFSVWQKQQNGEWKVFIDHGISHDPTPTPDALPTAPLTALDLASQSAHANRTNDEAEQQFIALGGAAYGIVVTPNTRILRDGQFPIDGTTAIGQYLKSQEGQWSWAVKLRGTSRANDLAYAVGNFTFQPKAGVAAKGQYVRVWVRESNGALPSRWTLAAEVLTPEPPPKT